ncbi:hypothetical protein JZ751_019628 [Albula glossodonta]|uniref:Uncharacterized protein n=1 Tax=Albula glossodonta TaxID=121402 RepID=A0A8T2NLT6_9TELE|nr:hypothetical protein JZ751_019628 [Albula glossodonta]
MLKMLGKSESCGHSALEVQLLPDNEFCKNVRDIVKIKMAKGSPLLCCTSNCGKMTVGDVTESVAFKTTIDGEYKDCTAERLLWKLQEMDLGVSELASLRLLSFADGRCFVMINTCILVQLTWQDRPSEPEILSCCSLSLPLESLDKAADYQICTGTLFVLASTGHICILGNRHISVY